MCSTPFGIIGIRTPSSNITLTHLGRCSTPFGIIGIRTLLLSYPLAQTVLVLNAFRHHRNSHLGTHPTYWCHQDVLNAFRHHRNSHSHSPCSVRRGFLVLHAFRHHLNWEYWCSRATRRGR